jgi:hypothetical protein
MNTAPLCAGTCGQVSLLISNVPEYYMTLGTKIFGSLGLGAVAA